MKFSFLPLFVAVAGLAVQQASASPIRVVVVTSHQDVTSNVRFGHAGAYKGSPNNDNIAISSENRRPCPGKLLRNKAIDLSNTFRKALGLPVIETSHDIANTNSNIHGGIIRITPFPFIGTPSNLDNSDAKFQSDDVRPVPQNHHHHFHHMKHRNNSFLKRVHHALMALGPWEGRAVAFVLGCGIGVLLRMFWVITVVAYRMIKGGNDEAPEYTLVCEHYAEDIRVAPPSYIYETAEGDKDAEEVDAKTPTEA